MKLNYKNFTLDNETEKIKENLQAIGAKLQEKSAEPKVRLMSELSDLYDRTSENKSRKFTMTLARPVVWMPAMAVSVTLIIAVLVLPFESSQVMKYNYPTYSGSGRVIMDEGIGASSGIQSAQPTFKQVFINNLGQHEASPEDIAAKGSILSKDINVNILVTKQISDAEKFAKDSFEPFGGYVVSVGRENYYYNSNGNKNFWISGKIPADRMDAFRSALKIFIGKDKYYQETISAQSRTADIIVIDQKVKDVQAAIKSLQSSIARETDVAKLATLKTRLYQNQAYLTEREQTKKEIMAQVDFVDVSLNVQTIPSFWHSRSFSDVQRYFSGFEDVSLFGQLGINALFVCLVALKIFSYTFWAIGIVIWLIIRKRRQDKWLAQME
ncbi:MAG: DUF4349 domain-containing protein [Parcubacteria group bacterium]